MSALVHSHFGVYAVILNKYLRSILLIIKARGPYTGRYDLPGGSPEIDELLEETLKREVFEETGYRLVEARQLMTLSTKFAYLSGGAESLLRHIGVIYSAKVTGDMRLEADGEDSLGCRWVDLDELTEDNASPFVLMALEHVLK